MFKLGNLDQETIKDYNKKKILNILYKERNLTKQEIAKKLNLSIPTVISNVNELIEEGLVDEAGVADSTGGRKPVIVQFIPEARYSFGVDIDLEKAEVILTNLDSEIKRRTYFKIDEKNKNIKDIMDKISIEVKKIIKEEKIPEKKILGIGISLPGTVNEEKLILEIAPNLELKNISFEEFVPLFNFPMYIENEANAAAYAELNLGVAKKLSDLVYISVTKGIGTGIVIKGHLYKGKNRRAGELGHMTIFNEDMQCKCGKKGCWELYASEKALLKNYNMKTGERLVELSELFDKVDKNEIEAVEVLDVYLKHLSIGIQNIILIFDPDYIIIGGKISNYDNKLIEPLTEKVFLNGSFFVEKDSKILFSRLKEDSSILGASLIPMNSLFFLHEKII